jgi:hypothetical protein
VVVASATDGGGRQNLAAGGNEKVQLSALIGAFKNAVEVSSRERKDKAT